MTREEKAQIIDNLVEKFSSINNFYVTDASGLTVAEVNDFRRICHQQGVEYRVIKNTLIQKALEKMDPDYSSFNDEVLKGFSGIIFGGESFSVPAKVIKEYRKKDKNDRPIFKGASIETDLFIGDDKLDMLAKLKTKAELIGEIIGLLQSPVKNVISSLNSGQSKLTGIVKTLSEKEN